MDLYKLIAVDFAIHGTRDKDFDIDITFKYGDISKTYHILERPLVDKKNLAYSDIFLPLQDFISRFIEYAKLDCEEKDVENFFSKVYDDLNECLYKYANSI